MRHEVWTEQAWRPGQWLECRGASQDFAAVVAGEAYGRDPPGQRIQVHFVRRADIKSAVGDPNRLLCVRGEVSEELPVQPQSFVAAAAGARHLARDPYVETVTIYAAERVRREFARLVRERH